MNRWNEKSKEKNRQKEIDGWRDKDIDGETGRGQTDRQSKTTLCFTPSNNENFKINGT